jgi:hypothetical protein
VKISDLCLVLDRLAHIYGSAGANGPASDLKTFKDALSPHSDIPVNEFVRMTLSSLSPPSAKSKRGKRAPAAPKSEPLNEPIVRYHVNQLRTAGVDRIAFDRAIAALNDEVRLADLAEIARQYSSTVTKYKTIASAQQAIAKAFVRQARFANKIR